MPRFFFHLTHDGSSVNDSEGVVLPDRIAAWEGRLAGSLSMSSMINWKPGQPSRWTFTTKMDRSFTSRRKLCANWSEWAKPKKR
jgi:hypothetical protein